MVTCWSGRTSELAHGGMTIQNSSTSSCVINHFVHQGLRTNTTAGTLSDMVKTALPEFPTLFPSEPCFYHNSPKNKHSSDKIVFFAAFVVLLPPGIHFPQRLLKNTLFRQNSLLSFIFWRSSLGDFHETTRIEKNTVRRGNHCFGAILRSFCRFVAELTWRRRENYLKNEWPTKWSDHSYVAAKIA